MEDLASRLANRVHLSTDGLKVYIAAVEGAFGWNPIDYAMLVKVYGPLIESDRRYSPPELVEVHKEWVMGKPDMDRVSTSFVEAQNMTMRQNIRRLTRLTNGHSKKLENHIHAMALWFLHYNFARKHSTPTKQNGGIHTSPSDGGRRHGSRLEARRSRSALAEVGQLPYGCIRQLPFMGHGNWRNRISGGSVSPIGLIIRRRIMWASRGQALAKTPRPPPYLVAHNGQAAAPSAHPVERMLRTAAVTRTGAGAPGAVPLESPDCHRLGMPPGWLSDAWGALFAPSAFAFAVQL
jgi:hypothetical protein